MSKKMKIEKEKQPFKKEYIFVILFIFVISIICFCIYYVLTYDGTNFNSYEKKSKIVTSLDRQEVQIEIKDDICPYDVSKQLLEEAEGVQFSYKMSESRFRTNFEGTDLEKVEDINSDYYTNGIDLIISGLTENLRLMVEYGKSEEELSIAYFKYEDTKNGEIKFTNSSEKTISFYITIFSDNEDCNNIAYKSYYVTTPLYNEFSQNELCELKENFDKPICSLFTYEPFEKKDLKDLQEDTNVFTFDFYSTTVVAAVFVVIISIIVIKIKNV